jgi:hypothetical protein
MGHGMMGRGATMGPGSVQAQAAGGLLEPLARRRRRPHVVRP